ncbi:hypothetical protein KRR40_24860 [Niabella defluvii]|nr:hypothetical protein KRR40_24860 [Niabella sp. I65]
MLNRYAVAWRQQFAKRLRVGRVIQANFGKEWQTVVFINTLKRLPWLANSIIKATHGKPF